MPTQIQLRRGTYAQHQNFTGAAAEPTFDTSNKVLRLHDGSTAGGNEMVMGNTLYKSNPVRAVATSNITLSGTQTIDGVALNEGDRVLVTAQTDQSKNGIYVVVALPGLWTRAYDFDKIYNIQKGMLIYVSEGNTHNETVWKLTSQPTTLELHTITFEKWLGVETRGLAQNTVSGLVVRQSKGTYTSRTLAVSGQGITITNGDGISGNPSISINSTPNNTASTIMARDASGNFIAQSATLQGTLSVTGDSTLNGNLGVQGGNLTTSATTFNLLNTNATTINVGGAATNITVGATGSGGTFRVKNDNVVLDGNLTVNGTTVTTNSTTITIDDPILTLGGDTAPTSDDAKDRGVEFRYYSGAAKLGFIGWDNSAGRYWLLKDATNTSEVYSGTLAELQVGILSVDSGQINTQNTTFNLLNANATTLNIGGAATSIVAGASTGSFTINNPTLVGSQTTQNVFNTTATTVNAFGAALSLNIGNTATGAQTTNIASGATAASTTKTLNLATNGAVGSTTNVNIGSTAGGTLTINNPSITVAGGQMSFTNTTDSTLSSNGSVVFAGGIGVAKNIVCDGTFSIFGDISVNGGDILTNQTSVTLFNATATTANLLGAASTINLGANSGTLTIGNPTVVGTQTTQNVYNTVATTVNAFGAATSLTLGGTTGTATIRNATVAITNNATVGGTLAVTGATTITDDLAVNGGDLTTSALTFNLVNANATTLNIGGAATAVTIGALTGTATIRNATTAVTGNLTVGGTASVTGNTTLSGTLGVTGNSTLSGTLAVTGATTLSSTLAVTGDTTLTGDVAVNGGDITTNQTTFNLVNANATTLNIGGAATAINLGNATTATLTVRPGTLVGTNTTQAVFDTTATTVNAFGAATTLTLGNATGATATIRPGTVVGSNTTQNLWNTVATSVNFAGAATTLSLGASTGTTTVNNNLAVTGTSSHTGNATFSGTLSVTGTSSHTGNATFGGTVGITGDLAVNTNKFNVTAASGNTAIAGTLGVTGNSTLSGTLGVTGATTLSSTLGVTGATTLSSTLGVTGVTSITNATASTSTSTGALVVTGGVGIGGSTYVGGDLNIAGNITIAGTATTISSTNLSVSDPLIYMGTGNSGNTADIGIVGHFTSGVYQHTGLVRSAANNEWRLFSGVTTEPTTVIDFTSPTYDTLRLGTLNATGNLNVTGTSSHTGNATFSGTVGVTGATTLSSTLAVTGATTLSSTLGVTGDLAVNTNKFNVTAASGNTSIAGTLGVTGATTLSSTLGVTGATTLSSTLAVTGTSTFTGATTHNGGLTATTGSFSSTLGVTGAATLSSTLGVTGLITSTGGISGGAASHTSGSFSTTLGVTGATTLSSTLAVTGATTLSSTLGVTGDFAINTNKFNVTALTGNTAIAGTLGVTGASTFTGATTHNGGLSSTTGSFSGNASVGGTLSVTGAATHSSTISATQYTSTIVTGTAPLVVASTTAVTNLNSDLLDGQHGSYYQDAGNLNAGTIPSARVSGSYTGITGVGTITAGTWTGSTIAIANGGTGGTTAQAARTNILPAQSAGVNGYVLTTNGTDCSWSYLGNAMVTTFNGRANAVTLTSADVTTALGFTPLSNTSLTSSAVQTALGYSITTGRHNGANQLVHTDANGYIQCGYINSANGDENNSSNPDRVWGTNGSDSYMRTYRTSSLSVNYANSAGSATSATYAGYLTGRDAYTNGSDGWWRTNGNAGWYNATYAVGIYATQAGWVQTYNSAGLLANAFQIVSDERVKENIVDSKYGLETVLQLRSVEYDKKADGKHDVGLIAQEVEQVVPEMVFTSDDEDQTKSVNYPQLVSVLIKAVQELSAEVESLKAKVGK